MLNAEPDHRSSSAHTPNVEPDHGPVHEKSGSNRGSEPNLRITSSSWTVNRKQFPLRAAYATAFNGSQGLTLQRAIINLRSDPFDDQPYTKR